MADPHHRSNLSIAGNCSWIDSSASSSYLHLVSIIHGWFPHWKWWFQLPWDGFPVLHFALPWYAFWAKWQILASNGISPWVLQTFLWLPPLLLSPDPWIMLTRCRYDELAEESIHEQLDRKSTRLNSSHIPLSRMPSSA